MNSSQFKQNRNSLTNKVEVLEALDKYTGTNSSVFFRSQLQAKSMAEKPITKPIKQEAVKGVSQRLNLMSNFDEQKSFMYVGQAATNKERLLKWRANIIGNDPGIKINGVNLEPPPANYMKKL